MPLRFVKSVRDVPPEGSVPDARAEAEVTAFVEALRRIGDGRYRACIRWFVLQLANEQ